MFLALCVVGSLCRVHETVSTQAGQPSPLTRALGTRAPRRSPSAGLRLQSRLGTLAEGCVHR